MRKAYTTIIIFLIAVITYTLIFDTSSAIKPQTYYQVYLDGEKIGVIESKKELVNYINNQGIQIKQNVLEYQKQLEVIRNVNEVLKNPTSGDLVNISNEERIKYLIEHQQDFNISDIKKDALTIYLDESYYDLTSQDIKEMQEYVDTNKIYLTANKIYTPNGIEIKKMTTYNNEDIIDIPTIYNTINAKKSFTVAGYKFTIKQEKEIGSETVEKETELYKNDLIIYVTDPKIFEKSIETVATIFIGEDNYNNYKNHQQPEIVSTGSKIENIYIQEEITYKAVNIDTTEKIYTSTDELSKFLLYGDNYETKTVTVKEGDSIESVAFNNAISVEELLISNTEYTSRNNLLYPGKEIIISKLYPQINIVEETYSVSDIETNFTIVEQYDSSLNEGTVLIAQEGEKGLERVTQNVRKVNGNIEFVEPIGKETLKANVNSVVVVGTKRIPHIGSLSSWGWPTDSGYTISSYYGYRLAIFGGENFHSGIDIAGTGYGSAVYAANNGTIITKEFNYSYGNYIMIDHGNGYYSIYAHLSGFASGMALGTVVSRGQTIGYVGTSGWATGPHLHYEIRNCQQYSCTLNPLSFY